MPANPQASLSESASLKSSPLSLTIVIVAWNCRDELEDCLQSLESGLSDVPVYVVDNASSDGTREMVRHRFPNVRLVANDANLGFGPAHNIVLRAVQTDFALILNPDTILNRDAVIRCHDAILQDVRIGVVSCRLIGEDGLLRPGNIRALPDLMTTFRDELLISWLWRMLSSNREERAIKRHTRPFEVEVVSGAFMYIRTVAGREVDFFDDDIFLYGDDTDLCYRLRQAHWKVFYVPDASIIHLGARSTAKASERALYQFYRSEDHYFRKHYPLHTLIGYRSITSLGCALRAVIYTLLMRTRRSSDRDARVGVYVRVLAAYGRALLNGWFFRRREILRRNF